MAVGCCATIELITLEGTLCEAKAPDRCEATEPESEVDRPLVCEALVSAGRLECVDKTVLLDEWLVDCVDVPALLLDEWLVECVDAPELLLDEWLTVCVAASEWRAPAKELATEICELANALVRADANCETRLASGIGVT